jgi:hypothetical protein
MDDAALNAQRASGGAFSLCAVNAVAALSVCMLAPMKTMPPQDNAALICCQ